jgi:hypothetical protein
MQCPVILLREVSLGEGKALGGEGKGLGSGILLWEKERITFICRKALINLLVPEIHLNYIYNSILIAQKVQFDSIT